ncbi:D-alanyl-D-alanine carboxypeptidase family protein [Pseudahrensia aquimaris]|uniref:D-alanyl-D-alanine carboxypeptidase family protein n=1 Tax=Pseudahrensia aquimaris TaxID=744461 RepID=A0ABW3FJG8_9HYPH
MRLAAMSAALVLLVGCTTTGVLNPQPIAPKPTRYAAIVMDARTGRVLHSEKADARRFPASLTKMMTVYMLFEALDRGQLTKSTPIYFSRNAARKPASKLGLRAGQSLTTDQAIQALVVKSANDVATAVAERLGGSEAQFARTMTLKARSLGMNSTTFKNASGLPDRGQISTARDMAKLSIALKRRFPHHYHYFGKTSFKFGNRTIRGHNRVLGQLKGANGIKTGYTRASGFNLATSVTRGRRSYVGVVMGENSGGVRNKRMVQLMNRYAR